MYLGIGLHSILLETFFLLFFDLASRCQNHKLLPPQIEHFCNSFNFCVVVVNKHFSHIWMSERFFIRFLFAKTNFNEATNKRQTHSKHKGKRLKWIIRLIEPKGVDILFIILNHFWFIKISRGYSWDWESETLVRFVVHWLEAIFMRHSDFNRLQFYCL